MADGFEKLSVMIVMANLAVKSTMKSNNNSVRNRRKRWQKTRAIK